MEHATGGAPRRRRHLWIPGLGLAGLGVLGLIVLAGERERPEADDPGCEGAGAALAPIWNPGRRAAMEARFLGTGHPYAGAAWARVSAGLDHHAAAWTALQGETCRAQQRGQQSELLADRRTTCLARSRIALASAIDVLGETEGALVVEAVQVVYALPSLAYCVEVEAGELVPRLPAAAVLAPPVAALREDLARAGALAHAGRHDAALAVIEAVEARAEDLDYRPLLAEALLARGRVLVDTGARAQAAASLDRAVLLGLAAGMDALAVEALARRIFVDASFLDQRPEVRAVIPLAEALAERLPAPSVVHGLLLDHLGTVHMANGDPAQAQAYFERALAIRERVPAPDPFALTSTLRSLATLAPAAAPREALFARALALAEETLGPAHPLTLDLHFTRGHYTVDPEQAHAMVAPACALAERYHADRAGDLAQCWFQLGHLEAELGRDDPAAAAFARAAELAPARDLSVLALGLAQRHRGDHPAAVATLEAVLDGWQAQAWRWWLGRPMAQANLGQAASLQAVGRPRDAVAELDRAVALLEQFCAVSLQVSSHRQLARARVDLAGALWDQGGNAARTRALALIAEAEGWYRQTGGLAQALADLAAWRRARDLAP